MDHTAHTLATRHFHGLVLSVDCTGTVSVLDSRDRDPMRPFGLRRFVPTDVVMPFGGVDPHNFPESTPLGQAWLGNLTRAAAEDIAVRVIPVGHGLIRKDERGVRWAECTCGWSTTHGHTGDLRWSQGQVERDWQEHRRSVVTEPAPLLTDSWSDDPDRTTRRGLLP